MTEIEYIVLVALITGIVALVVGILAKSIKIALGCAVACILSAGGLAAFLLLRGVFQV